SGAMGYNADIITAAGARAIAERFEALLRSLCQDPAQAIGDANLLSPSDRARLAEWNSTTRPLPPYRSAHGLLAAQAARTPDQVALRFGTTALRSEEHTSELQSRENLVCRLLLEKKKT